jgi:hypothetical protein
MPVEFLAILLAALSFVLASIALVLGFSLRRRLLDESQMTKKLKHSIDTMVKMTEQQYGFTVEHGTCAVEMVGNILDELSDPLRERLSGLFTKLKREREISLRKMEASSLSIEIQKDALRFFAGGRYCDRRDVVEYIGYLLKEGLIHHQNRELAMKVFRSSK